MNQIESHEAHISATATVLTVAVPLAVYVLTLFALYTFLVRAVDPFHIALLGGTAALLVLPVMLATLGAPMAVCLVVLMLAPLVPVIGYETRIPAHGYRGPAHPRPRPASHWIAAVLHKPDKFALSRERDAVRAHLRIPREPWCAVCGSRARESGQPVVIAARRKKASEVNGLCWRRDELESAPLDITPWKWSFDAQRPPVSGSAPGRPPARSRTTTAVLGFKPMSGTAADIPPPCACGARQRVIEVQGRRIGETPTPTTAPRQPPQAHVSSDALRAGPAYFDHDDLGRSLRIGHVGGFDGGPERRF
jgi:hypothetical protein